MILNKNESIQNTAYQLHQAFSPEMQIYSQATLKRVKPLSQIGQIKRNENNEISILFNLKGELDGKIICSVDLSDHEINRNTIMTFQSLFSESMNILLGQFLTDLESQTGLMSIIDHPEVILKDKSSHLMETFIKMFAFNLMTEYELITPKDNYFCQISIFATKVTSHEV